jgi:hypothetical protein
VREISVLRPGWKEEEYEGRVRGLGMLIDFYDISTQLSKRNNKKWR